MARTPRVRHLSHRELNRLRHSEIFLEWLQAQATRLSTSIRTLFDRLKQGETAEQINASEPPEEEEE